MICTSSGVQRNISISATSGRFTSQERDRRAMPSTKPISNPSSTVPAV